MQWQGFGWRASPALAAPRRLQSRRHVLAKTGKPNAAQEMAETRVTLGLGDDRIDHRAILGGQKVFQQSRGEQPEHVRIVFNGEDRLDEVERFQRLIPRELGLKIEQGAPILVLLPVEIRASHDLDPERSRARLA